MFLKSGIANGFENCEMHMNIIVSTDGNIPSKRAHSISVMKMAQGFHQLGMSVSVVSLLSLPIMKNWLSIRNIYDFYGVTSEIEIKLLPVWNRDFFSKSITAKEFHHRAVLFIKKRMPEVVYSRSYLIPYYAVKSNLPVIIETHTTLYEHPDVKKLYEIAAHSSFLGLVTISEKIKREHIRRGVPEDKIIVLEDGVDLDLFNIEDDRVKWRKHLRLPENKRIVMYCGHLYDEKGIEHILLTARGLEVNRDVIFVIVGGYANDGDRWKRYCSEKNISNVLFTGFVNNSLVPKYLKSADVLIMPYKGDMHYKMMDIDTTSPLKMFEYMASKRPIVSTDIPAISKVLKHNHSALLAEPDDIGKLSIHVLDLLRDAERGEMLATNALNDVVRFEWKERCRNIIARFLKR